MEAKTLRRLCGFLKPYPWAVPILVVIDTASSFAEGIGIGLMIPFFELLLHRAEPGGGLGFLDPLRRWLGAFSEVQGLVLIGGAMLLVLLAKVGLVLAGVALSAWLKGRVNDDLRRGLFGQVLGVDYAFLVETHHGRLVNAFHTQIWRVADALDIFFTVLVNLCTIGVFTALLLYASWQLTLVVVGFGFVVSGLIGRPLVRHVERLGGAAVAAAEAVAQQVLRTLDGMRVIRAFGQEAPEAARFARLSERIRAVNFRVDLVASMIPPSLELLYAPIFLGAALVAWRAGIGVPTLIAFLVLFYRLQPHIKALDRGRAQLAGLGGAIAEIAALLDPQGKPLARSGAIAFSGLERGIDFRDVGFCYQADALPRVALAGASFEVRAGEVTAIVGASGAGKSTLINLLYRLYEPSEGEILVDGRPLALLDIATWRARLALAGQDAALLDGTIADNIAFGRPEASRDDIVAAARLAAAHDFVERLPAGYDTEIGDRGVRLSEGQRQRLGLARALIRRPQLLILDEATNALDGLTEEVVYQALAGLAGNTTVILIAHRLSTLRTADRVVVLHDGRVVEQGTPAQLLARRGEFARLYAAQAEIIAGRLDVMSNPASA